MKNLHLTSLHCVSAKHGETSIGNKGASAAAAFSAVAPPMKGVSRSLRPAIGRSTSRDQWMSAPVGGLSLYWRRSYQPCPSSSARTCIIRMLSSVSTREKPRIAAQRSNSM